jgi:hypothetical protein
MILTFRDLVVSKLFTKTEVSQFNVPILTYQNVLWLQVSIYDALSV